MRRRTAILLMVLALLMALTPCASVTAQDGTAAPADTASAYSVLGGFVADSIAVDTTDYEAGRQRDFNAMQYSLDGYHRYSGDSPHRNLPFIAVGGGRMTINDNSVYDPSALYQLHLRYGRQLNDLSTLRVGIEGALGFIRRHTRGLQYRTTNGYFSLEADYLYSVTSFLMGYRPERPLDVSAFVGVGVGYSHRFESEAELVAQQLSGRQLTGRLRGGLQLKFFAGPQAALALEPFVYMSTKGIDLVRNEYEFYSYRVGGGLDISYIYYLDNRLTKEGDGGEFRRQLSRRQRYLVADMPPALQRHPLVLGLRTGAAAVDGHGREYRHSAGPSVDVSLAWWLSPMLGLRGQAGVDYLGMDRFRAGRGDRAAYIHGALDLLFDPFASLRRTSWQQVAGLSLVAGYEGGRFYDGTQRYPGFGYHGGVNLWTRITDGVTLTLEPQYAVLTNNGSGDHPAADHVARLRLGVDVWLGTGGGVGSGASNYPLGRAGIAVGRGLGAAGAAVGQGVATASVAIARGVAAASVFVANGVADGSVAVARGIAGASVAVAKGTVAAARGVGAAGVAVGRGVGRAVSATCDQSSRPLFMDYALGYQHITDMPTRGIDTWEPQIQIGAGWWPTGALGVRGGFDFIRGSSAEREVKAANGTFTRYEKLRLSFAFADVMVNPLGFRRDYNWQSAAGVNLIAGRLVGNLANANIDEEYWRGGWRLGTQLWANVGSTMRLFVEPMALLGENDPQSDVPGDYASKAHRNIYSLKVGLSMLMNTGDRGHRQSAADSVRRWFVAVGGGLHFNKDLYRVSGGGSNSNLQLMGGYRVTRNSAVRLSEELTFDHFVEPCRYTLTEGEAAGQQRSAMGVTTFRYLFSSLSYQYDLLSLFDDSSRRRWQFAPLAGFAVSYYLNETTTVPGVTAAYSVARGTRISPANFNVLVGVNIGYRLTDRLSAYFNHHLFMYSFGRPQWLHYSNQIRTYSGNINTFNAGLQYDF